MGKTTNPLLWPVCDRATFFIRRGDEHGMKNCPALVPACKHSGLVRVRA